MQLSQQKESLQELLNDIEKKSKFSKQDWEYYGHILFQVEVNIKKMRSQHAGFLIRNDRKPHHK